METIQQAFSHPVGAAMLAGFLAAAAVDIAAFRSWKTFNDALAYDWKVASWRWFQGTALGALAGLGITAAV